MPLEDSPVVVGVEILVLDIQAAVAGILGQDMEDIQGFAGQGTTFMNIQNNKSKIMKIFKYEYVSYYEARVKRTKLEILEIFSHLDTFRRFLVKTLSYL